MRHTVRGAGERRLLSKRPLPLPTSGEFHPVADAQRSAWLKSTIHLAVVAGLLCLAAANIRVRATFDELEDGVLWKNERGSITAVDVHPGSAAAAAGIRRGDVLEAVDGEAIVSEKQIEDALHAVSKGQRPASLRYTVVRVDD